MSGTASRADPEVQPSRRLRLSLIVPLYNEAERVPKSAPQIMSFVASFRRGSEIIWVDDGSSDETARRLQDYLGTTEGIRSWVLHQPHRGKGAAVQAGIARATGEVAAFCDVDLATRLQDLRHLADVAAERRCFAIGSRAVTESVILEHEHRGRELLGKIYNRVVQLLLLPGIRDTQCGAKAAPVDLWRQVLAHCSSQGFEWDVEVLAVAKRLGVPIEEIGVTWTHDRRTRVQVLRDGIRMALELIPIWRNVRRLPRRFLT